MYWFDPKFTYEENCEEFISYMNCECETFDFGEGLMKMETYERGMYKYQVLHYLNSFYYPDSEYEKYFRQIKQDCFDSKMELKFDELSSKQRYDKENNKYHRNMDIISRRLFNCKYSKSHFRYPYQVKMDEDGNEYLSYKNDNKRLKGWLKNHRKVIKKKEIKYSSL